MTSNEVVYTKYGITNVKWSLKLADQVNNLSLGEFIRCLYKPSTKITANVGLPPYGNNRLLPFDVHLELDKLDSVVSYYYRNTIDQEVFVKSDTRVTLNEYNVDPWKRTFPLYVNGNTSYQFYATSGTTKYSCVVFYRERLLRNEVIEFNRVPLAILHITSLENLPVYCVDIIH